MKRDYWVTVCSSCRCASCWHGEFMCDRAIASGTVEVLASELRGERREHSSYLSVQRIQLVCGAVRFAP